MKATYVSAYKDSRIPPWRDVAYCEAAAATVYPCGPVKSFRAAALCNRFRRMNGLDVCGVSPKRGSK